MDAAGVAALPLDRILIINADDLGYCSARDKAIFDLYRRGALKWASVLLNGKSAKEALTRAQSCGLMVGLHLNLTEGPPLCKVVPSLVGPDGEMLGKMGFRAALREQRVLEEDLTNEIREQLRQYVGAAGRQLHLHIDGHQHVHVLAPVAHVLVAEIQRTGRAFSVRLPRDKLFMQSDIPADRKEFMQTVVADTDNFVSAGITSSDAFIGQGLMGSASTLAATVSTLRAAGGRTVEWMVHPGLADPDYGDDFNRSLDREIEFANLRSPELRSSILSLGYRLAGWEEI